MKHMIEQYAAIEFPAEPALAKPNDLQLAELTLHAGMLCKRVNYLRTRVHNMGIELPENIEYDIERIDTMAKRVEHNLANNAQELNTQADELQLNLIF